MRQEIARALHCLSHLTPSSSADLSLLGKRRKELAVYEEQATRRKAEKRQQYLKKYAEDKSRKAAAYQAKHDGPVSQASNVVMHTTQALAATNTWPASVPNIGGASSAAYASFGDDMPMDDARYH